MIHRKAHNFDKNKNNFVRLRYNAWFNILKATKMLSTDEAAANSLLNDAIKMLDDAINKSSKNYVNYYSCYYYRAIAYANLANFEKAKENLSRAAEYCTQPSKTQIINDIRSSSPDKEEGKLGECKIEPIIEMPIHKVKRHEISASLPLFETNILKLSNKLQKRIPNKTVSAIDFFLLGKQLTRNSKAHTDNTNEIPIEVLEKGVVVTINHKCDSNTHSELVDKLKEYLLNIENLIDEKMLSVNGNGSIAITFSDESAKEKLIDILKQSKYKITSSGQMPPSPR